MFLTQSYFRGPETEVRSTYTDGEYRSRFILKVKKSIHDLYPVDWVALDVNFPLRSWLSCCLSVVKAWIKRSNPVWISFVYCDDIVDNDMTCYHDMGLWDMNSSLESVRRPRAAREKLQKIAERISGMGLGPRRRVQMVRISTVGKGYKYHSTLIAHSYWHNAKYSPHDGSWFSDLLDKKSLGGTWRRTKHKEAKKKSRSLKSLRKLDIFSSSPSLMAGDHHYCGHTPGEETRRKCSVQLDISTQVLRCTSELFDTLEF